MKIYQHVDELNDRDGIGNDILGFNSLFKRLNQEPFIVTRINNSKEKYSVYSPFNPPAFFSDDIHILHYGGTGYPVELFKDIPGRKILRFHNMTPVSFFKNFMSEDLYKMFEKNETKAHLELYSLCRLVTYFLSDSTFNKSEFIKKIGTHNKVQFEVIPIIRNYPPILSKKTTSYKIGFLGRIVPNKKIEDLLFTLYFLKKIHPNYVLILIGKKNPVFELYNNKLDKLISELKLSNSIEIYENLTDEEVKAQLSNLDIYISMSEHEGFGIPILEAMAAGVPVLAYSSSAVIETVRDAGLLFSKKDFPLIAELVHTILTTPKLISIIIKSQLARLQIYNQFPFEEKLSQIINSNLQR